MRFFRRRLRRVLVFWLLVETASLSALVPPDCCAAHRTAAETGTHRCHSAAGVTSDLAAAPDSAASPAGADHSHHGGHGAANRESKKECSMRGTCNAPYAALLTLLFNPGVLNEAFALPADLDGHKVAARMAPSATLPSFTPDPPPPRA